MCNFHNKIVRIKWPLLCMDPLREHFLQNKTPFPVNMLKYSFSLLLYFGERILHVISITFMLNGIAMKEMTPYRIRTQTSIPWRLSFRSLFLLTLCSCCRRFFFQEQLRVFCFGFLGFFSFFFSTEIFSGKRKARLVGSAM